ncbi:magnesium transporter CorA family protein [Ancylobacter dichloromethanicus]|uniref:Magnesium transport protein CorA n=1 Tax=Ancylobacter dichloromethanicus TaxID=518825 RepID=A0A9W6N168_9HYPH|nr:magnesium transporter CorA family protein [Ancylobacter dichloromethanicus]MBS7552108.1 magnesium transporter CorA family protein [Ancylobacter dichloromethanicus]GLK73840.1 magnesium transporter [Ancylobacter dichloromethanicus]
MITAYCLRDGALASVPVPAGSNIPPDAVWVDLFRPGEGEDRTIEAALGISVPTREEMVEIEPSSRLRVENGARYMTGAIVCNSEGERPALAEISFILAGHRLTTVRYDEPRPFRLVVAKLDRICAPGIQGERLLLIMLDTIIDRAADIIERLSADIDAVSRQVLEPESERSGDSQRFRTILKQLGRRGDLASKVRESLVSMGRLVTFLYTEGEAQRFDKDQRALLKSMQRDVASLTDHVSYLGSKITFLLDATLGMVGIEQNNIIKIFAVLSVVFMPPTLIASVYGMNFQHMPELDDRWGYPIALLGMLAAAVGPYLFFKWKRWM